jgi:hypothetical protein
MMEDVLSCYHGWNGKDDPDAPKRLSDALFALGRLFKQTKLLLATVPNART